MDYTKCHDCGTPFPADAIPCVICRDCWTLRRDAIRAQGTAPCVVCGTPMDHNFIYHSASATGILECEETMDEFFNRSMVYPPVQTYSWTPELVTTDVPDWS